MRKISTQITFLQPQHKNDGSPPRITESFLLTSLWKAFEHFLPWRSRNILMIVVKSWSPVTLSQFVPIHLNALQGMRATIHLYLTKHLSIHQSFKVLTIELLTWMEGYHRRKLWIATGKVLSNTLNNLKPLRPERRTIIRPLLTWHYFKECLLQTPPLVAPWL